MRDNSDMSSESLCSLRLSAVWDGERRGGGRFKAALKAVSHTCINANVI